VKLLTTRVWFAELTLAGTRQLPNVVYRVPTLGNDSSALDFDEDLMSLGLNSFDYIRMAHLNGAVADEPALLRKVFECVL
jgi:hypothetical protein